MRIIKKYVIAGVLIIAFGLTQLCLAQSIITHAKLTNPNNEKNALLFTQTAAKARIKKTNNQSFLVLKTVNAHTLWFLDRPGRKAGTVDNATFVKLWNENKKNSFKQDNPNANLVSIVEDPSGLKTTVSGVFELAEPIYNAKENTITYKIIKTIKPFEHKNMKPLQNIALFIDNFCGSGCPFP